MPRACARCSAPTLRSVPFENLAVQLGESAPLELQSLVDRSSDRRAGRLLLRGEHGAARAPGVARDSRSSGGRRSSARGTSTPAGRPPTTWPSSSRRPTRASSSPRAASGRGRPSRCRWRSGIPAPGPSPTRSIARATAGGSASTSSAARLASGWPMSPHRWPTSSPTTPGSRRQPDSRFVQTLVVQRPFDDHILSLRSRTLSTSGPGYGGDARVLEDSDDFAAILHRSFGIDPDHLGAARITRLWEKAVGRHARIRAAMTHPGSEPVRAELGRLAGGRAAGRFTERVYFPASMRAPPRSRAPRLRRATPDEPETDKERTQCPMRTVPQ